MRMHRECRECFPFHFGLAIPTCITARASRIAVSFEVRGGENVPGIPGACASRNFTYLVRVPLAQEGPATSKSSSDPKVPSNGYYRVTAKLDCLGTDVSSTQRDWVLMRMCHLNAFLDDTVPRSLCFVHHQTTPWTTMERGSSWLTHRKLLACHFCHGVRVHFMCLQCACACKHRQVGKSLILPLLMGLLDDQCGQCHHKPLINSCHWLHMTCIGKLNRKQPIGRRGHLWQTTCNPHNKNLLNLNISLKFAPLCLLSCSTIELSKKSRVSYTQEFSSIQGWF